MITAPHPSFCNVQLHHVKLNMLTEFLCILPCSVIRNVCFDRQCVIIQRAPWCRSPLSAIWGATAADSGPSQVENTSECSLPFSLSGSSSFIFGNLLSKSKVTYGSIRRDCCSWFNRFFPASLKYGVGLDIIHLLDFLICVKKYSSNFVFLRRALHGWLSGCCRHPTSVCSYWLSGL